MSLLSHDGFWNAIISFPTTKKMLQLSLKKCPECGRTVLEAALDAGAEDVEPGDGYVDIYTKPQEMEKVRAALEAKKVPVQSAEVTFNAKNTVNLEEKTAFQALKLLNRLEEMDDVQSVSSNADFSDEIMQKFQELA